GGGLDDGVPEEEVGPEVYVMRGLPCEEALDRPGETFAGEVEHRLTHRLPTHPAAAGGDGGGHVEHDAGLPDAGGPHHGGESPVLDVSVDDELRGREVPPLGERPDIRNALDSL